MKGPISRYIDYQVRVGRGEVLPPVEQPEVLRSRLANNNEFKKRAIGVDILSERFLISLQGAEKLVYEITDPVKREVRCLGAETSLLEQEVATRYEHLPEDLKFTLLDKTKQEFVPVHYLKTSQVREIVDKWRQENGEKVTIKSFAWKGDPSWTLRRLDFDLSDGPTPCWDEFIDRCDEKKATKAFFWSIVEERHTGRQGLYFRGKGFEGKSEVIKLFAKLLGLEACGVLTQKCDGNNFSHSAYWNKRLLVYPDCRFPSFVKSELFRNYSTGEIVEVEYKYMNKFSAEVYARVMIASNFSPDIDDEKADRSRLLLVHVAPLPKAKDGSATGGRKTKDEWVAGMLQEMPHFLYKCREAYNEVCEGHSIIRVDDVERHEAKLAGASDASDSEFEAIMEEHGIKIEDGAEARRASLSRITREARLPRSERNRFVKYLEARGVSLKWIGPKESRRAVWKNLRLAREEQEALLEGHVYGSKRGAR